MIPQHHRVVSLLPLSHLMEQVTALFYALDVGADILYVRSRNPRVIFEAIRDHHVTTMVVVPQVLDLFWGSIEREVEKAGRQATFNRLRRIARRLPYPARRLLFRSVHKRLGGGLNLFVSAGAFLPPSLQQAWEDVGVVVMQGYGATECGPASATSKADHGLGTVGRTDPAGQGEARAGRRDPHVGSHDLQGLLARPRGDGGRDDARRLVSNRRHRPARRSGHLILMGRTKDIIVLPNGLNVYPEDIENALRVAGVRDSVVLETAPGRIEAIVLAPGRAAAPPGGDGRRRARDPRRRPRRAARADQCRGQGGERDARHPAARRRLATLARRGLSANPHAQGQARPGAGLGRRRRAAAGPAGARASAASR